jgi:hypothetical protein
MNIFLGKRFLLLLLIAIFALPTLSGCMHGFHTRSHSPALQPASEAEIATADAEGESAGPTGQKGDNLLAIHNAMHDYRSPWLWIGGVGMGIMMAIMML